MAKLRIAPDAEQAPTPRVLRVEILRDTVRLVDARHCTPDDPMRPPRDPNDTRYWSLAHGGSGNGFTGKDRRDHPARFSAATPHANASRTRRQMSTPSVDALHPSRTPEAVRIAARTALLLAVHRMENVLADDDNPLTLNELSQAASSLGRIALPQGDAASGPVTITVVRRAAAVDGADAPRLIVASASVRDEAQAVGALEVTAHRTAPEDADADEIDLA